LKTLVTMVTIILTYDVCLCVFVLVYVTSSRITVKVII